MIMTTKNKYLTYGVVALIIIGIVFIANYIQQTNNKENTSIENCAKEGEKSTSLDMTSGKLKPGGKSCCEGLKEIWPKTDDATLKKGICIMVAGNSPTCVSCGDNICNPQYEDKCNCPEDCK